MPVSDLGHAELVRLYGPWAGRTPRDAAALMAGYPGRWWVAGGWAVSAFTGVERPHDDLDLELPRAELPLLRRHLAGRLDVWAVTGGSFLPLLPGDDPDAGADEVLPEGCGQVWLRAGGTEPWEYDVLLVPGAPGTWEFKRDARIRRPLEDVCWSRDGIPYLRTEVQLLLKARGLRPKDRADFEVALPRLERGDREWLRESLRLAHPGHPWLAALDG